MIIQGSASDAPVIAYMEEQKRKAEEAMRGNLIWNARDEHGTWVSYEGTSGGWKFAIVTNADFCEGTASFENIVVHLTKPLARELKIHAEEWFKQGDVHEDCGV